MMDGDSSLHDKIHSAIQSSPYFAGRKLRYEAADGRVILHGTVGSYFQKQMAQEALRGIEGLGQIENRLEVAWASGSL